jgi:hypothetical protein
MGWGEVAGQDAHDFCRETEVDSYSVLLFQLPNPLL